ncbi:MAG: LysR family transcriptional regulator [Candidatus Lindowbacteria bacterium]|nr:LysR family transcriptional regulator [Candidatus Lindowbacteria bacterium]
MKTRKPKNAHSTRKRSGMKYRFKVWAEVDGEPVMGPGRYRLLEELRRTRSINAAAKKAGISYRRAWAQIREMERLLGYWRNHGGVTRCTFLFPELTHTR